MKRAMWIRLRCDDCGEYELLTVPIKRMPAQCHHCEGPVEVVAQATGQTMQAIPQITKPRPVTAGTDFCITPMQKAGNSKHKRGKRNITSGSLRMVKR